MKRVFSMLLVLLMLFTMAACGGKSKDVTGKYQCVSATLRDGSSSPSGEWVELKKGGKGTYFTGGDGYEFDLEWQLDGTTFTGNVTFIGMEDSMNGTLQNGVLEVKYGDYQMRFVKEGADVPTGSSAAEVNAVAGGSTYAPSGFFDDVTVAATLNNAFLGAAPGGSSSSTSEAEETESESGFVSPTTSLRVGQEWYGTMRMDNYVGIEQEPILLDAFGIIDKADDGSEFFELFVSENRVEESLVFSTYINLFDDHFEAVIGDKDAFISGRYLTSEEDKYFSPYLENGALEMSYPFDSADGKYSCTITIFIREAGMPWDRENDLVPPNLDKYENMPVG